MEDFSQSRGDDDLFDDEIIPIENAPSPSPENMATQLEQVSLEPAAPASVPPPIEAITAAIPAPQAATTSNDAPTSSFRQKPRGRGSQQGARGGGGRPRKAATSAGLEESKWATPSTADSTRSTTRATSTVPAVKSHPQPQPQPQPQALEPAQPQPETTTTEPAGPQQPAPAPAPTSASAADDRATASASPSAVPAKPPAVRGDRTLTGGLARVKLTDEQLTAKLAAAKERSQNVAAAHARAQADAASFQERERIATEKRAVANKERRVMEGEREKNRLRKLGNREGREWDRDKEDVNPSAAGGRRGGGGGGGYAEYGGRGFTGAAPSTDDDLRQYEWHDGARGRGTGRGRGGRGGGGRDRGRGRGGAARGGSGPQQQQQQQPDTSAEVEFPALPGSGAGSSSAAKAPQPHPNTKAPASAKDTTQKPSPRRWDSGGAGAGGGTWADQVESSELDAENADNPKTFW
ncbi:hypothetical protein A1O7_09290 [Cladophialophora yegresii CBS 114405]|uniref:Uncharacterized protein n=1 Tax=Cladophialophora yegresii CBS 114405 TaxID=1182544 RepID=W9VER5_9EURO|nr:uncharacterized protein A1O7_09290 [Cladophialophora yegresii CBS 114405]EXJ53953.1 hypothetical protein A1O7_09290 [Cladophialophora yegresii CBS 114405]